VPYVPIGISAEPPPPDLPAIHAVNVGSGGAAELGQDATRIAQRGYDVLVGVEKLWKLVERTLPG
jgi:hypothetical protein